MYILSLVAELAAEHLVQRRPKPRVGACEIHRPL